jgi:flagellin
MSLSINTNVAAMDVHRNLLNSNLRVTDSLSKLSSGLRVASAKDDASGYSVANAFKASIAALKVASQNANEGISMLQVADGGYSTIQDMLVRMKALATEAASGQSDQSKLVTEFTALQSEIDRIADSTTYNGKALINAATNVVFQVGEGTTAGTDTMTLAFADASATTLAVDAASIQVDTAAHATAAITAINAAIGTVNTAQAAVGALQNRLQYTVQNLQTTVENYSASESTIRDVDMAAEVTNLTKNQILQQTGMAMLAQANSAPQQILTLLRQ